MKAPAAARGAIVSTYYDTSSLPFRAPVKVKPLARLWCPIFRTWFVRARITTRIDYSGRRPGDIVYARVSELRARQRVSRQSYGRLYFVGAMPDAEFLALPDEGHMQ
jgi:hypothetical protein